MKKINFTITVVLAALGATLFASQARADLIFNLGTSFNGTAPSGSGPWFTADFHTVTPGTVTLTLTPNFNSSSEFISQFAFNIKPVSSGGYVPGNVTVESPSGTSVAHTTDNGQKSPSFGNWKGWDFVVSFPTDNQHRFDDGTAVITLKAFGLTAEDFNYFNSQTSKGQGSYYVGAHVQGIPGRRETSGAIGSAVPEASTMIAGVGSLVLLLLGIGVNTRRSNVIRIGQ